MEAHNQTTKNMLRSPCKPKPTHIAIAAYTIRTPYLDPEETMLRDTSTHDEPYYYECNHFEENCHHCHGDHLIRYVFAAYPTG